MTGTTDQNANSGCRMTKFNIDTFPGFLRNCDVFGLYQFHVIYYEIGGMDIRGTCDA